ncbi:hypothetical protein BsWGS_00347 [Bradybaena similaris]
MNCTTRLKIGDINKSCICVLCGGYIIDATTIIECLHSFCRTCIVTYLKTSKNCPVCDTLVHKTRPHQNIRSDKLLQDLVYKLVPGLYKDEMRRRREFYTKHYEAAPKRPGEERGDEMSDRFAYTEEEKISLSLHFCPEGPAERVDFRRVFSTKEDLRGRMEKRIKEAVDVRYLQCKAAVTIGHLKKFVRLKYALPPHFQVDMFYNDEPLRNSCTLCDVAYYFNWTRRAPLMLTFSVFESTKQASLVKECSHLTNNTSLNINSAPNVTASRCKQAVAVPTEISTVEADFLAATPVVPTEGIPSLDAVSDNPAVSDLQGESRTETKNSQSKAQSSFVSSANESHDQNGQCAGPSNLCAGPSNLCAGPSNLCAGPSNLCAGPSKLPACPVKRPPGPSKHPPKTKSSSLGKRTASMPIHIAPAPAKISALNNSVLKNIMKTNSEQSAKGQNSSKSQPRLVSFLPLELSQPSVSEASHIEDLNKSRSALNFSASSVPSPTSSGKDILTVSRNNKPPSSQVFNMETATVMTSCSSQSTSLSSNQPFSTKPKPESSFRTFMCAQNQLSRHLEASSSTLSSCTSSLASSTLPPSSDSVSIMQSSSSTAVASPTPASSASPTPAAIPSQQSQTQSLDKLHTKATPLVKHTEVGRTVATDTNSKLPCQTDQKYMLSCKPEASRPCKIEVSTISTNIQYENHSGTPNCGHRVTSGFTKCEVVNSATESKSSILKTEHKPFGAISSATVTSSQSNSAKKGTGDSSDTSPPSNGAKISAAACVNLKQNKQKKIADIANTLHKRVSDALLSMVSKHANSPNRRPSQSASPGLKSLSIPQTPSNLRETAIMNAFSCPSFSVKQSVQNMPPERRLLVNGPSSNIPENNHNDEPLNLVKRDREMAKFMNGMFILDIPPSIT